MRNLLSALAIIVFGFALSFIITTSKPKPEKNISSFTQPPSVTVIQANPENYSISVDSFGVINAKQAFDLVSEVSGQVLSVSDNFINGGTVLSQTPLVEINAIHYQSALAKAKSALKNAQEKQAQEEALAFQAKKEWRELGSSSANALFLRKPQLASAKAQVKAAEADIAQAEYNLKKTHITLGFDAVIMEPFIQPGQFISIGTKIASLYAKGKMQVVLPVTQAQLTHLNLSWPVESNSEFPEIILSSKIGDKTFTLKGEIRHTGATIDRTNQLVYFIVDINDPNAIPGLYVDAQIKGIAQPNILRLPEDALFDQRFILVVNSDNRVEFRQAVIYENRDGELLVKADIQPNEWIIIDRLAQPFSGMTVNPIKPNNATLSLNTPVLQRGLYE